MNTPIDLNALNDRLSEKLVYVKPLNVSELPADIQEQADGAERIYSVHDAKGEQIALVANRQLAYHIARKNEMSPVRVH